MSTNDPNIEEGIPIQKPDSAEQKIPVMNAIPPELVLKRAPMPETRESSNGLATPDTTSDES